MFGIKKLIDTPVADRRKENIRDLDFTPVGDELSNNNDRSIRQENNTSPLQHRRKPVLDGFAKRSPLMEHSFYDSAFDNTAHSFDTINSDQQRQKWNPDLNFLNDLKAQGIENHNEMDNQFLLSKGSNPLKQQHDSLSKLQEENLNLRVRLATLIRYFGDEPAENKDLLNHNVELKQNLIQMNSKLETLEAYVRELEETNKENQMGQLHEHKVMQEHESLQHNLRNANSQIDILQDNLENAKSEIGELQQVLQERDATVESLQRKTENLSEMVDELQANADNNADIEKLVMEHRDEVRELHGEMADLQAQLRDKDSIIEEVEMMNKDLEEQLIESKQKESFGEEKMELQISELKSMLNRYEDKIEAFQNKENHLINEIENLESQHDLLQKQLEQEQDKNRELQSRSQRLQQQQQGTRHDENEYIQSLEKERESLYDQLLSSQDKLSQLDRELNSADLKIKTMLKRKDTNEDKIRDLKTKNSDLIARVESLESQLRDASRVKQNTGIYSREQEQEIRSLREKNDELAQMVESLTLENKYSNVRKTTASPVASNSNRDSYYEQEIRRLTEKNDDLQRMVESLRLEKSVQHKNNNPYLEQEIRRLSDKNNDLQHMVDSLSAHDSKTSLLTEKIQEQEDEIETLQLHIRDLIRQTRLASLSDDDEKISMMQEISKLKNKLNLIQIEKNNLKEEYSLKLSLIKKHLQKKDNLQNDDVLEVEKLETQLTRSIKLKDDLLVKLSDKQQEIDELLKKNDKLSKDNRELEKIMFALEDNEAKMSKENKEVSREAAKLRAACNKLMTKLKQQQSKTRESDGQDNLELKMKLDDANNEIDQLTQKYIRLHKELKQRIEGLEDSKKKLKQELIRAQYPTPISSPIQTQQQQHTPPPASVVDKVEKLKLASAKLELSQQRETIRDLQTYNNILNKSLQRSNQVMKRNVIRLDDAMAHPSASSSATATTMRSKEESRPKNKRRLTFKSLAMFVLASVKLQHRMQEANRHATQQRNLKRLLKYELL